MRVVHVSPYFLPEVTAGIEVHVYEFASALRRTGVDTAIYCCGNVRGNFDGIEVHRFPYLEVPGVPHLLPHLQNPIPFTSMLTELGKEYDVIHVHGLEFLLSWLSAWEAHIHRLPLVTTIHNSGTAWADYKAVQVLRKILDRTLFAQVIDWSDVVIAINSFSYSHLDKFGPKKKVLIPLALNSERFRSCTRSKKNGKYVLFTGRLVPVKGAEDFIRAVPKVLEKEEVTFAIVGSGPQYPYLMMLAENMGISRYIRFIGSIEYSGVPKVLSNSSVFVAPGNAGYALLEAAAAQKPIVSVNEPWNRGILGKNTALWIEKGNTDQLADAILRLLTDTTLAKELAANARRYVEKKRTWRTVIDRYKEVYSIALDSKSNSLPR